MALISGLAIAEISSVVVPAIGGIIYNFTHTRDQATEDLDNQAGRQISAFDDEYELPFHFQPEPKLPEREQIVINEGDMDPVETTAESELPDIPQMVEDRPSIADENVGLTYSDDEEHEDISGLIEEAENDWNSYRDSLNTESEAETVQSEPGRDSTVASIDIESDPFNAPFDDYPNNDPNPDSNNDGYIDKIKIADKVKDYLFPNKKEDDPAREIDGKPQDPPIIKIEQVDKPQKKTTRNFDIHEINAATLAPLNSNKFGVNLKRLV